LPQEESDCARPCCCWCGALRYQHQQRFNLAAVVEFIHTATLLHDDVVDASTLRRGRATANETFGNPASVLVGIFCTRAPSR
jgi:octaprenyl-diphosphate synthase